MIARLHVTFGRSAEPNLKRSFDLNKDLQGDTLALTQDLSIGPLQDLDTEAGQKIRTEWFSMVAGDTESLDHLLELDDENYQTVKSDIGSKDIYVWLGSDCQSKIAFMKLAYELRDINGQIFVLNYPKYFQYPKKKSPFVNIGLLTPEQILTLNKNFRPLTLEEKAFQANAWMTISNSNSRIRVVNEHGEIKHVGENYFDELLLSFCTHEFRKSARIVGETLWEVFGQGQTIDDAYLGWRLKELVRMNILSYEGTLDTYRNYNVKLKS